MSKEKTPKDYEDYADHYSDEKLGRKISKYLGKAKQKVIYAVLVLYYSIPHLSPAKKAIVFGALGYFIFPIDAIPDIIPIGGFADDLTALTAAVIAIKDSVSKDDIEKASEKAKSWLKKNLGNDYVEKESELIDNNKERIL